MEGASGVVLPDLVEQLQRRASQGAQDNTPGGQRVQLTLLQKLEATLLSEASATWKPSGHALVTSMLKLLECACACPVRACILRCLKIIFSGDPVRMSLAHGSTCGALQDRIRGSGSDAVVLTALLEVLALHARLGTRQYAIQAANTVDLLKTLCKNRTIAPEVRAAALRVLSAVALGAGKLTSSNHGLTAQRHADLCKLLRVCDAIAAAAEQGREPNGVRKSAFEVFESLARVSAPHLWEARRSRRDALCVLAAKSMEDAGSAAEVRYAAAMSLAALLALPEHMAPDGKDLDPGMGQGAPEGSTPRTPENMLARCLLQPLTRAVQRDDRHSAALISMAHARFIRVSQAEHALSEEVVVQLGMDAIRSLSSLGYPTPTGIAAPLADGESPVAQACILYILHTAVLPHLGEPTLRNLLSQLGAECSEVTALFAGDLQSAGSGKRSHRRPRSSPRSQNVRVPEAVVLLATMSQVLLSVGEVAVETARDLRDKVHKLMMAAPSAVGYAGAAVLGQLGAIEGGSASQLMMEYVSLAKLMTSSLGSQAGPRHGASLPVLPASGGAIASSWERATRDLQGCVLATCALMGAVSLLPLGCPSSHVQQMYGSAVRMVQAPLSTEENARCEERRLGCLMLSCLTCNLPLQMLQACEEQIFECLTSDVLGNTGSERLNLVQYQDQKPSTQDWHATFVREATWRCAALEALRSWIQGYVSYLPKRQQQRICARIAGAATPVVELVAGTKGAPFCAPHRHFGRGPVAATISLLRLRLIDVFLELPCLHVVPAALLQDLVEACAVEMGDSSDGVSPHACWALKHLAHEQFLSAQDSVLAAHLRVGLDGELAVLADDALDRQLLRFAGRPGALHVPAWQLRPPQPLTSKQVPRVPIEPQPFPQPISLDSSLAMKQAHLLGAALALLPEEDQVKLVRRMIDAVAAGTAKDKKKSEVEAATQRLPFVTVSALAALTAISRNCNTGGGQRLLELSACAEELGHHILAYGVAYMRAGAEVLACAAAIGGGTPALRVVHLCCERLAAASRNASLDPRPWALILGTVHRRVGGMALQSALGDVVTALAAYAKSDACGKRTDGSATFALHGLFLVMASAFGPSQWVELVLETALDCLLRVGREELGLQPTAAAIVTAIVEVQGPSFCPTSKTHPVAEAIMAVIGSEDQTLSAAISSSETAALLQQRVLCARSLIAFAADIPKEQQLPVLSSTLRSSMVGLRLVAAASLHQLARSNIELLVDQRVEFVIFVAIDTENHLHVRSLLEDTLLSMMGTSRSNLEGWIQMLCNLIQGSLLLSGPSILPAGSAALEIAPGNLSPAVSRMMSADPAEDELAAADGDGVAPPQERDLGMSQGLDSNATAAAPRAVPGMAPTLATKAVAMRCLLQLLRSVLKSEGAGSVDALAGGVQHVVQCAFYILEENAEALKPGALDLMGFLLDAFQLKDSGTLEAAEADELLESGDLDSTSADDLRVFAALYVTSLKACLQLEAGPVVVTKAAPLAARVMACGMLDGDDKSAEVLFQHLLALLDELEKCKDQSEVRFAEWVTSMKDISLLHGIASCITSARQRRQDATMDLILQLLRDTNRHSMLLDWLYRLCLDATILTTERAAVHQDLRSSLLASTSSFTVFKVEPSAFAALPQALSVACTLLASSPQGPPTAAQVEPLLRMAARQLERPAGPSSEPLPLPSRLTHACDAMCALLCAPPPLTPSLPLLHVVTDSVLDHLLREDADGMLNPCAGVPATTALQLASKVARAAAACWAAIDHSSPVANTEGEENSGDLSPGAQHASSADTDGPDVCEKLLRIVALTSSHACVQHADSPTEARAVEGMKQRVSTCCIAACMSLLQPQGSLGMFCAVLEVATMVCCRFSSGSSTTSAASQLSERLRTIGLELVNDAVGGKASEGERCWWDIEPFVPDDKAWFTAIGRAVDGVLADVVRLRREEAGDAWLGGFELAIELCSLWERLIATMDDDSEGQWELQAACARCCALCSALMTVTVPSASGSGAPPTAASFQLAEQALRCLRKHILLKHNQSATIDCGLDMLGHVAIWDLVPCVATLSATWLEHTQDYVLALQLEAWRLVVALVSAAAGHVQECLYGVLLVLLVDALSQGNEGRNMRARAAAYHLFKSDLRTATLAPLMPKVVPKLTEQEKSDLRVGLQQAEIASSAVPDTRASDMHDRPKINFAAFH